MVEIVTDPLKQVTDPVLLSALAQQGVDNDYVEFFGDYNKAHPYAKIYRDLKSNKRFMVVSGLPMVDADEVKIETGWRVAGINYFSEKNNLFRAKVQGTQVEVTIRNDQPDGRKAGDKLSYNPQCFLYGVEQPCSQSNLIPVDPINSNYLENTLEWDYGICKRRLRIIEGKVLGSWVFAQKPSGEVNIKYNQIGDFRLKLGQFAISDDEEQITPDQCDELAKLQNGYPITIQDSLTVYSSALDGASQRAAQATWAAAHDTTDATHLHPTATTFYLAATKAGANNFYILRGHLYFDTSALTSSSVVTDAVLSLYGETDGYAETDATMSDIGIVEGTFDAANDGLANADYGLILPNTTLGHDAYFDSSVNWTSTAYFSITLNSTGRGWISKTGITKFGVRVRSDIANSAPTGYNSAYCYASEKGNGYKPKLVVTFHILTTQSVSGAISTITGGLSGIHRFPRALSGTVSTITGALSRKLSLHVALSGAVSTITGALVKKTSRLLSGAISSIAGALSTSKKQFASLSGAVTMAGAIAFHLGRILKILGIFSRDLRITSTLSTDLDIDSACSRDLRITSVLEAH